MSIRQYSTYYNVSIEADHGVLKAHLDAGFEKQSSNVITVGLNHERWLEIVSRVQDDSLFARKAHGIEQ